MADSGLYDLVLMDIKMPVMDGLEATRRIKEAHPELPVVALTANAFDSDRQMAQEAGCVGFLSKPVNREECMKLIKSLIGE
jgi:CheY-like chemotaxis protein